MCLSRCLFRLEEEAEPPAAWVESTPRADDLAVDSVVAVGLLRLQSTHRCPSHTVLPGFAAAIGAEMPRLGLRTIRCAYSHDIGPPRVTRRITGPPAGRRREWTAFGVLRRGKEAHTNAERRPRHPQWELVGIWLIRPERNRSYRHSCWHQLVPCLVSVLALPNPNAYPARGKSGTAASIRRRVGSSRFGAYTNTFGIAASHGRTSHARCPCGGRGAVR